MTSTDATPAIRVGRSDLTRADDGTYLIPLLMNTRAGEVTRHAALTSDDAARLHAQLSRHLNQGWATSEEEKMRRQSGEVYPVGGP